MYLRWTLGIGKQIADGRNPQDCPGLIEPDDIAAWGGNAGFPGGRGGESY